MLSYPSFMATIQVRGISPRTQKRLKAKAKNEGKSLSEYLRGELELLGEQPTIEAWLARVESREPVGGESGAEAIRAARAERESQLDSR